MAIGYSLDLQNMIGTARKQQRLQYLKNYWMERVSDLKGIKLYTSLQREWGFAIGTFGFEGKKAVDLSYQLFKDHKIHTVGIEWEKINGVRVTPNVYSTTGELDKLVQAIRGMV